MTVQIEPAGAADVDEVVRLQIALFDEDAAAHDAFTNPAWPREHGRADIESLLTSDSSLVLVARAGERTVDRLGSHS